MRICVRLPKGASRTTEFKFHLYKALTGAFPYATVDIGYSERLEWAEVAVSGAGPEQVSKVIERDVEALLQKAHESYAEGLLEHGADDLAAAAGAVVHLVATEQLEELQRAVRGELARRGGRDAHTWAAPERDLVAAGGA